MSVQHFGAMWMKTSEKPGAFASMWHGEYQAIPIAPHIYFPQFLSDEIAEEREFGLKAGLSLLSRV